MALEDIFYARNRHYFGGIAPSNMKQLRCEYDSSNMAEYIYVELPDDTIIDGQTVCSVEGAVLRFKEDGYPKDEFDGEDFGTYRESGFIAATGLTDSTTGLTDLTTGYISAFPFSTQGVYNRNKANRLIFNDPLGDSKLSISLERSVLQNRKDESSFATLNVLLNIKYTKALMDNGKIEGFVICTKHYNHYNDVYPYPESMDDENIRWIVDVNTSNSNIDVSYANIRPATGVINAFNDATTTDVQDLHINITHTGFPFTMYYSIFPYYTAADGTRKYVYNDANKIAVNFRYYSYLYGFDLDTTDANPNTRVTYPNDVDNSYYTPAKMNYDAGVFEYGDWPSRPGVGFMPAPVMLSSNGSVYGFLHPDNYDKIDIVGGSKNQTTSWNLTDGKNAMMQWSKIYVKRSYDSVTGIYKFRCSDYKFDDTWECWSNYDSNNKEIDHFYTPIYNGGSYSNGLRSMSGLTVSSALTVEDAVTMTQKNGSDWYIEEFADRLLIQDLLILMSKTTNCQDAYGRGVCGTSINSTGKMNAEGLFWGSDKSTEGVKVFGMEHWWGNYARYMAGLMTNKGVGYVKLTRGTKDGTTVTGYSISDTTGYISVGSMSESSSSTTKGFIRYTTVYNWGRVPSLKYVGSATTYEADHVAVDGSKDLCYANVGGNISSDDGKTGPFNISLAYNYQTALGGCCAAISYKPSAS